MRVSREPRTILYTGIIVLSAIALGATIAFGQLADHDPIGGMVLIAGFAFMGIVALIRTNERYRPSKADSEVEADSDLDDDRPSAGRLGREGFGGPGNPDSLLRSILILQAAIIVISSLTRFDTQAWVFVFYFIGMDFALWVIMKAQKERPTAKS